MTASHSAGTEKSTCNPAFSIPFVSMSLFAVLLIVIPPVSAFKLVFVFWCVCLCLFSMIALFSPCRCVSS